MGFEAAGFNKVLQNLARVTPAVIAELAVAIELVQNKVVERSKRRHEAKRTKRKIKGSSKKDIVPSLGGKNRLKNPDGTPRYGDRTGRLTGSIRAMSVKTEKGFLRGRVRAGTGAKVDYAPHVEFGGTVARKRAERETRPGESQTVGFRKPHPFMRPALRDARRWERLTGQFTKAIQRGLKVATR